MFNEIKIMYKEDFKNLKNRNLTMQGKVLSTKTIASIAVNGEDKSYYNPTTVNISVVGDTEMKTIKDGDLKTCPIRRGDVVVYKTYEHVSYIPTMWDNMAVIGEPSDTLESLLEEFQILNIKGIVDTTKYRMKSYDIEILKERLGKMSICSETVDLLEMGAIAYSVLLKDITEKEFKEKLKKEIKGMMG